MKTSSQFLLSEQGPVSQKAWKFPWISHELKNTLGKLLVAVNSRGHLTGVLNEVDISDSGKFCPLWLVILLIDWFSVWDTLKLQHSLSAIVSSETDWNIWRLHVVCLF